MEIEENFLYTKEHEWVSIEDNIATMGITDYAQSELGDIVFIELPAVGRQVAVNEALAVVESVKTASELFSPVTGTVVAVNDAVVNEPELVNDNAFQTWLFRIRADNPAELDVLMDAEAYQQMNE